MIEPSIDELLEKADNKYSLAVVAAKRARELVAGAVPLTKEEASKPVTTALFEINEGKVKYTLNKKG